MYICFGNTRSVFFFCYLKYLNIDEAYNFEIDMYECGIVPKYLGLSDTYVDC